MKHKTDTSSMLIFQNLQRTQIFGAASLISPPSSKNPNSTPDHAKDCLEIKEYEGLLQNLTAQCLKRQIKLMPYLEQNTVSTFKPKNYIVQSNVLKFHLLSC